MGTVLRLVMEDAGEKGMDREVTSLDPMIESAVDCHVVAVGLERLEQLRGLVALALGFGKEVLELVTEKVADGDEAARSHAGSLRGLDR